MNETVSAAGAMVLNSQTSEHTHSLTQIKDQLHVSVVDKQRG